MLIKGDVYLKKKNIDKKLLTSHLLILEMPLFIAISRSYSLSNFILWMKFELHIMYTKNIRQLHNFVKTNKTIIIIIRNYYLNTSTRLYNYLQF